MFSRSNLILLTSLFILINQAYAMNFATNYQQAAADQVPRAGSLAYVAYSGNYQLLSGLVVQGCPIDELDINGKTPLQEAICRGYAKIATFLIDHKESNNTSINRYSSEGLTALHYAVIKRQWAVVNSLLVKGAVVNKPRFSANQRNSVGETALHMAAMVGDEKIASLLLSKGANAEFLDAYGCTPLHYAACCSVDGSEHKKVAEQLVRYAPGTLDKEDVEGATPLMSAIVSDERKKCEVVKFLVEQGADVNKDSYKHSQAIGGITPLMMAVMKNNAELVDLLIRLKANINATCRSGHMVLDFAITQQNENMQRLLLAKGADHLLPNDCIMENRAYWILFPIHEAADAGDFKRVQVYTQTVLGISHQDHLGRTPLHYACMKGHLNIVTYLISQFDAAANACDRFNKTPVHYAIEGGFGDVVEFLVHNEPSLMRGIEGTNYLNYAASNKKESIVIALIKAGAHLENLLQWAVKHELEEVVRYFATNVDLLRQQDENGKTALHYAIEKNNPAIVESLVREGASLDLVDRQGRTPLDYCAGQEGIRELIKSLTDVDYIVEQHCEESRADEGNKECSIALRHVDLENFGVPGIVEYSLSQRCLDQTYSFYCGYYALFNALSCFMPERGYTRQHFVDFFRQALQTIKNNGGKPPYDLLTTAQLRLLIKKHCQDLPIAVFESNNIDAFTDGILLTPEVAFELKAGDTDLLTVQNFINKRIDSIAIITGSGVQYGHWITIFAQRHPDDKVFIKIFDSFRPLSDWGKCPIKEMAKTNVHLLYLMLTNSIETWREVLKLYRSAEPKKFKDYLFANAVLDEKPTALIEVFDEFIESLWALRVFIEQYCRIIGRGDSIPSFLRVAYRMQLETFDLARDRLWQVLRNENLSHDLDNGIHIPILDFNIMLSGAMVQNLLQKLSVIANTPNGEKDVIQKDIQIVVDKALELKNKLVEHPHSMTSGNFYDAPTLPIHEDKLAFIEQYLQPEIRSLVEELKVGKSGVRKIIFYGAPGNGKTTIAQAIAQWCKIDGKNRPFRIMRVPAMGTKYQFSKQEQLSSLHTFIEKNPHAVILLDEIDALADSKCAQDHPVQLFQQITDFAADKSDVIFIGTTNSDITATEDKEGKDKPIAPSLRSRFECIKIDNPTVEHRCAIIENCREMLAHKSGVIVCLTQQDELFFAQKTNGFSIRDLETMFTIAYQSSFSLEKVSTACRQVTKEHFLTAYETVKKGKAFAYWPMIANWLRNGAIHGPALANVVHGVVGTCLQEWHRKADREEAQKQRADDRFESRCWQSAGFALQAISTLAPLAAAVVPHAAPAVAAVAAAPSVITAIKKIVQEH